MDGEACPLFHLTNLPLEYWQALLDDPRFGLSGKL
ncbi:hypothetical protein SAMN05216573_1177 [Bradyrhizobium sp. Rc3b]|nr:hypothetical protein SAMN05216573_1177 [Bradyrhizobium sp. Rc3b]